MNFKSIVSTILLVACPLSVLGDQARIETAGIAPKASFILGDSLAIAALLEAGYEQSYRGNLTAGYEITPQHRVKAGGEYLLQHQEINFATISDRKVWVDQYAGGLAYQFLPSLPNSSVPLAFEVSGYGAYTPDKKVTDTTRIAQANTYGVAAGFAFELVTRTIVDIKGRYDNTRFINEFSDNESAEGLGYSAAITQPFTDRTSAQIGADAAAVYSNYYGNVNYLIPLNATSALELGVKGQYTSGRQGISDALAGFITIGFVGNAAPAASLPATFSETLLDWTNKPAVYMPLVLAKADESLNGLLANIPTQSFTTPVQTSDLSIYFAGSPSSFSMVNNQTSGTILVLDSSTGLLGPSGGGAGDFCPQPLAVTVTATYPDGTTVTSNTFAAFGVFF